MSHFRSLWRLLKCDTRLAEYQEEEEEIEGNVRGTLTKSLSFIIFSIDNFVWEVMNFDWTVNTVNNENDSLIHYGLQTSTISFGTRKKFRSFSVMKLYVANVTSLR